MGNPDSKAGHGRSRAALVAFLGTGVAALVYGVWIAFQRRWVSDDAFISFRYADNFVRGLGLVFNPGERVEGYSNFLWTMWTALGLWVGQDAERWATAAGIACYLAALALLIWNAWTIRRETPGVTTWIPLAAMLGALHPDWQIFATGGLETSLFTLEITALYVLLATGETGLRRSAAAGLLLALACMTRPDGLILVAATSLFVLVTDPRRPRSLLALGTAFLIAWVPYTAWRVSYFGDFFPNTYYAKSGGMAWYSQGSLYLSLYFTRYWALLLGPILVAIAWLRSDSDLEAPAQAALDRWKRNALFAAMLALAYTGFVYRVGGDFMFGRFLIPVTPLLLVLIELGVTCPAAGRARWRWLLIGTAAAGIVFMPYPLPRDPFRTVRGIAFEPNFYEPKAMLKVREHGLALRRYFTGLPIRMLFFGGEARLVYYARPDVAIECVTGLTDHEIARQPLKQRGRIGHEKLASVGYVLNVRNANITVFRNAAESLRLDREIPAVDIDLGGIEGRILTWESSLIDSLRDRGASVQDFPAELDGLLAAPTPEYKMLDWFTYEKMHRFYFANGQDPRREALFLQRLREAEAGG